MDKYSSSVSMMRLSNSLAMFDILDNLPLNYYSKIMVYPALTNSNQPLVITLIIVGVVLVLAIIIFLIIFLNKKKKGHQNSSEAWLLALGDKDNVKEVNAVGSRLSINLIDKEKIDREKLKELGVSSVLVMSNKITLVIEGKAEKIAALIKKDL